jgi:hypothetical protein
MWCLHISGNCRPSDRVSGKEDYSCAAHQVTLCHSKEDCSRTAHLVAQHYNKEDCSRTAHLVALCHGKILSNTAKRAASLMSCNVQTQDVEVRSIITYLTFICFINFINAQQLVCQMPCIFHTCFEASPNCSGLSSIIRMILTNTLCITKILLPCYIISADISTFIFSAVNFCQV